MMVICLPNSRDGNSVFENTSNKNSTFNLQNHSRKKILYPKETSIFLYRLTSDKNITAWSSIISCHSVWPCNGIHYTSENVMEITCNMPRLSDDHIHDNILFITVLLQNGNFKELSVIKKHIHFSISVSLVRTCLIFHSCIFSTRRRFFKLTTQRFSTLNFYLGLTLNI